MCVVPLSCSANDDTKCSMLTQRAHRSATLWRNRITTVNALRILPQNLTD